MAILSCPPSADDVRNEVAQALSCDEIAGSHQLTSFLAYIVKESLAGRSDTLKNETSPSARWIGSLTSTHASTASSAWWPES